MATGQVWPPTTAAQLQNAADAGLLEETHVLDLKREVAGGKATNKKLASDIAAFSIDGGTIIIGVEELSTGQVQLYPIPTSGLAERIEQIGLSSVSESVQVRTTVIPADDDGNGYLVVRIPASSRAPHMADGRYYGRGDKTNIVLDAHEVLRHHRSRLAGQRDATELARSVLDRSPVSERSEGVVCFVADPVGASRELLDAEASRDDWKSSYRQLFVGAMTTFQDAYAPTIRVGLNPVRRPGGVALPVGLNASREPEPHQQVVECYLGDDGRVELFSERAVTNQTKDPGQPNLVVMDPLIVGNAVYATTLAGKIAATTNFEGQWSLAVICTGLLGATSRALQSQTIMGTGLPVYTTDEYSRAITATSEDLIDSPEQVAGNLVLPLLRALDSDGMQTWASLKR